MEKTFAVIKSGGKQYKVKIGDIIKLEKLSGDKKTVEFEDILFGKRVKAIILSQGKLPKVRVLKFHRRKRYKRNKGHRQQFSEVKIESIK